jgi:hypothetical protein
MSSLAKRIGDEDEAITTEEVAKLTYFGPSKLLRGFRKQRDPVKCHSN